MPTYVAFLRAINLGATRKFPKAAIVAATEAAGGRDVQTWINTGNVLLTSSRRSRARVEADLEEQYAAAAGFEVPTIAFTPAELATVADDVDELAGGFDGLGMHYVSLLKVEPDADTAAAAEALSDERERMVVRGRAAHLLMAQRDGYHGARLGNTAVERRLGVATSRNATVVRTLAQRWCGRPGTAAEA
jgi:uncharacterized protein (DUF1697 family)